MVLANAEVEMFSSSTKVLNASFSSSRSVYSTSKVLVILLESVSSSEITIMPFFSVHDRSNARTMLSMMAAKDCPLVLIVTLSVSFPLTIMGTPLNLDKASNVSVKGVSLNSA